MIIPFRRFAIYFFCPCLFAGQLSTESPVRFLDLKMRIDQLDSEKAQLLRDSEGLENFWDKIFSPGSIKEKQAEIQKLIDEKYDPELAVLKLKLEKLTATEKIQLWNLASGRFNRDKRTLQAAFSESLGFVIIDGKPMFFKNESDFNRWLLAKSERDNADHRVTFHSQKSKVIQSCLAGVSDKARVIKVDKDISYCSGSYGDSVKYETYVKDNIINVDLRLQLNYRGTAENMPLTKKKVDNVQACIRKIFARNGLKFNLRYAFSDEAAINEAHADIRVLDAAASSNSLSWGVLANQGTPNTDDYLCSNLTHELLHRLGIEDRYADPKCPGRVVGQRDEVMVTANVHPWNARIRDDDIQKIIEPLCGKR